MVSDLSKLEQKLGIQFKNKDLLKEAITHRSYLNENPSWNLPHNERLEFLGDAVLELAVTEDLFNQYPQYPEGQLTSLRAALVNYQAIATVARDLNLGNFILLSRGEAKDVGRAREVILANAMEALLGAIYLDNGYQGAKKIIERFVINPNLDKIIEAGLYKDPKSHLQEVVQEKLKLTPTYQILEEWGPDHKKIFRMGVYFGEKLITEGEGYSKQEAEIEAAKNALKTYVS
ncbi:ribonuclease III [Candidatus Wolfebacteria bacterium CG18_big_fil_WC_8_21_14_2_50_39_7]|uniref:Ribonuclease 3 n=5 Tax=Candidatus Wolfeibacteriota TaxID=1752735 RepID=A0A2M7Q704_9BACT|nr:ribonuclease III [Parcubacteria group bacterium]NCO89438.1 ribonuclease III [Candidatus Wolfebacteria bacterium]OIO64560.1 MAG: ribonuclease III [Candidatus Wolfebacteria bacterium CG1_02_39_135]PIP92191.1 MAG: ribonuclease III [Candidatus Wolfebacteria bacterium CG18_big_fil_WC_8_21_14_2_50_39_7]PIU98797.1 MAG: ribonuclease III [Candidatus Wolfebacteria bacterium CG03_land_8_20_14_0_80_39_317]PIY58860.1 MAG: ribonuclease III [Candidatus Wolfebacteria bacterium CG_4_10_14_0_8_um_filter_39_6